MSDALPLVFLSYSHDDMLWRNRVWRALRALENDDAIELWDDRSIGTGDDWYDRIKEKLDRAKMAVCLISPDFLASEFCTKQEIPVFLDRAAKHGMRLIPVLVRPCGWQSVRWLKGFQMFPKDGQSLSRDYRDEDECELALADVLIEIRNYIDSVPAVPAPMAITIPEDIEGLPKTGFELLGRETELDWLDAAWEHGAHVVTLVAWGGVGKSTLVNRWLEAMRGDGWRGARRVFGWSFFSQGTGERVTAADDFIDAALRFFGDDGPANRSPWAKGERLAELVRRERALLILDGMEPLQEDGVGDPGRIKDPALQMLVAELARDNSGLLVITTRQWPTDLDDVTPQTLSLTEDSQTPASPLPPGEGHGEGAAAKCVLRVPLEHLTPDAGRALLRVRGVRGSDTELEGLSAAFGNHALAVSLLAAWLRVRPGHRATEALALPDLPAVLVEHGKHPRRVLAALIAQLGDGPALDLLCLLGFFDRPADPAAIAALLAPPPIPGLTEHIAAQSEADRLRELLRLRGLGLLAPESEHAPGELDAHPLVREHLADMLRTRHPDAWRAGHTRLYRHYEQVPAKHQPETLAELRPLFLAVAHACAAGHHQEAFDDVYWARITRKDEGYGVRKLGAFGPELSLLVGFFPASWQHPVTGLTEADQAFALNQAAFRLRALGRLTDAVAPMRASMQMAVDKEEWKGASISGANLNQLLVTIGSLAEAVEAAHQAVDYADRSGEWNQRVSKRATLADARHQTGALAEAEALFAEAERLQKEWQPQFLLLYSLQGFRYCDLLLAQGRWADVQHRATQTLEWIKPQGWPLDEGLDTLSLGRAALAAARAGQAGLAAAVPLLDDAVEKLRQAGQVDYIPRGLLARAALRREMGRVDKAQRDLDETFALARRCGMKLFLCDAHLEQARLHLSHHALAKAQPHAAEARTLIQQTGYHRRDPDLAEIDAALKTALGG